MKATKSKKQSNETEEIEETEEAGFKFKPIYAVPLLVVMAAVALFMFGSSPGTATSTTGTSTTGTVMDAPSVGADVVSEPDPDTIYIPISGVNDGKAHFYEYASSRGKTIKYFVLKSSDGIFRAAFDACDVCYTSGKGYRQEGDYMVCNNCGQRFPSTRINVEKGGCNPAPLDRSMVDANYNEVSLASWTPSGYVEIKKSAIGTGARYF